MGWLTGIVFGLFVVFTGLLLEQPVAFAHAFIVQSTPTDNQVLQQSPHLVEITFDEPVQTVFGGLTVTNDSGLRVDNGDAHLQADNPRILECTLKSGLPDGVYQVQWRVISADGHPVSGIIPFRVGTGTSAAGAVTQNSGYTPGVDMLLIRSLFLLGLMLVQGGLLFWRFVLAPSLRATWLKPLTAAVAWLGGGLVLVGSLLALPLQTTIDAGVPWAQAFSPPLWDRVLFYSQFGLPWVTQCVVALVQLLLLKRLYDHPRQAGGTVFAIFGAGAVLAWTRSVDGHATGTSAPGVSVLLDMVHIGAASLWVGGLATLVVALWLLPGRLPDARAQARTLLLRFGLAAVGAVVILALTGLWSALQNIPTWSSLFHTTYGQTLLLKLGFVAAILLLALVQRLALWRNWRFAERGGRRWLLLAEALLAVAVIVDTSRLTNLPTARANPGPVKVQKTLGTGSDRLHATLLITPNRVGQNEYQVRLTDANGRAFSQVQQVTLTFLMTSMQMGNDTVRLRPVQAGVYAASGLELTMAGTWRVHMDILCNDLTEETADWRIVVGSLS